MYFKELPIDYWIFGHTHTPMSETIHGIKFVCNPFGYPEENVGYFSLFQDYVFTYLIFVISFNRD
jgi:hypothetical protein